MSFSEEKVVVVGKARYEHLASFKENNNKLELPTLFSGKEVSRCIFYDPGAILRGYQSPAEYVELTNGLLKFVQENPEVGLIIKPHPAGSTEVLKKIVLDFGCENVYLTDKKDLPYKYINLSDVVVTKFSTIGIEAMLLDVPVISVILDGEEKFKMYEEAVEYIYSIDALKTLLHSVFKCNERYNDWRVDQIKRQHGFLQRYFYCSQCQPSILTAKKIDAAINSKYSYRIIVSYEQK